MKWRRWSERDFLVEIGTEELPPKALRELELAFASGIAQRTRAGGTGARRGAVLRDAAAAGRAGETTGLPAAGAEDQATRAAGHRLVRRQRSTHPRGNGFCGEAAACRSTALQRLEEGKGTFLF